MQADGIYTDFSQLAALRGDARRDPGRALKDVAGEFEALFVQMMLRSMRDAVPRGGLFGGNGMETYEQMLDQQLALDLSRQGGVGLRELLVEQLSDTVPAVPAGGDASTQAAAQAALMRARARMN